MLIAGRTLTAILEPHQSLRVSVERGETATVRCVSGSLWLVRDGDIKDEMLKRNESLVIDAPTDLIALDVSHVHVERTQAAAPPFWHALLNATSKAWRPAGGRLHPAR